MSRTQIDLRPIGSNTQTRFNMTGPTNEVAANLIGLRWCDGYGRLTRARQAATIFTLENLMFAAPEIVRL
jgi:hypothetical protein